MAGPERDPACRYYSAPRVRLRQLRQLLYPRRCPYCRQVLGFVPDCPDCTEALRAFEQRPSRRLDPAAHYLGQLDGAAAPYIYTDLPHAAVLRAKYKGEAGTAVQLGCHMAQMLFGVPVVLRGGVELPVRQQATDVGYDLVVPVPSSRRGRGYNVPELMALPIAYGLGIPLAPKALHRVRRGRPQAGLDRYERLVNVIGAFQASDPERLEGRRILLVDDVITTGATTAACGQALLRAGAESVFAVAFAAAAPHPPKPDAALAEAQMAPQPCR